MGHYDTEDALRAAVTAPAVGDAYGAGSVRDALDGLFTSVNDGKAMIASAVTDKGVSTAPDASFAQMNVAAYSNSIGPTN